MWYQIVFRKSFVFLLFVGCLMQAQITISGKVIYPNKTAAVGANISIENSYFGDTSDVQGNFKVEIPENEIVSPLVIKISVNGFESKIIPISKIEKQINLGTVILDRSAANIQEVVLSGSTFSIGKTNGIGKMNALDVVMTGSSNGDIMAALESLPGTQKVGEDGKLYIRGGDARELGTYIDGMHVLSPYTSEPNGTPARGRFSPFLFKGISLSLGGYDLEYGQALSAVLQMETKDVGHTSKYGIGISPLFLNAGGTYAEERQSVSFSATYTNLALYDKIFPDTNHWLKPYSSLSGEGQWRRKFKDQSELKLYLGFTQTDFKIETSDINHPISRNLNFKEDNSYLNLTYQTKTKNGLRYFAGVAYSKLNQDVDNANTTGDHFNEQQQEIHTKLKLEKTFGSRYKMIAGIESFFRNYLSTYEDAALQNYRNPLNTNISALFLNNQLRVMKKVYAGVSARAEYNTYDNRYNFYPRFSLDYVEKNFQASLIYGKYFQNPPASVMAQSRDLKQEQAQHYILSLQYHKEGRELRAEFYTKKYQDLWRIENGMYSSDGYGTSKGFDLYFSDDRSIQNLKYSFSYSYNDSKRLYNDYPMLATPTFASKHNVRFNARYFVSALKTYFGLTDTFASGRPYNNPNLPDFNQSTTPVFNSLDLNASILARKNIIVYTSLTNVLGRNNIYNYRYSNIPGADGRYANEAVTAARKRFFFVGVFISLKNKDAYDVSNF